MGKVGCGCVQDPCEMSLDSSCLFKGMECAAATRLSLLCVFLFSVCMCLCPPFNVFLPALFPSIDQWL
ncbi:mCG147999 [Mus musculus]|nr:mCG147999 [Mus musculus]